jgi:tRNA dimethylallyltransferase
MRYVVIAGPTGVGKSDFAIEIALALRTEIVGADAFQIYAGLDLLSGQPALAQRRQVQHHLIGDLALTESCDAHRYATLARKKITELNQRSIVPLVVGGTGFYLEALEQDLPNLPAADPSLRKELELLPTEALLQQLHQRDPVCWSRIDHSNRRRINRALEVCIITGRPFSSFSRNSLKKPTIARVALERPRDELYARINERVVNMFTNGVIEEVAAIANTSATAEQVIGLRQIRSLLTGEIDEPTCVDRIQQLTRNYAKRQMTWFRNRGYERRDIRGSHASFVEDLRERLARLSAESPT